VAEIQVGESGFNGATVAFYGDDVTALLTRCESRNVPDGWILEASATPIVGDPWSHQFASDESVDIPVMLSINVSTFCGRIV
jgi:hypothetical protein